MSLIDQWSIKLSFCYFWKSFGLCQQFYAASYNIVSVAMLKSITKSNPVLKNCSALLQMWSCTGIVLLFRSSSVIFICSLCRSHGQGIFLYHLLFLRYFFTDIPYPKVNKFPNPLFCAAVEVAGLTSDHLQELFHQELFSPSSFLLLSHLFLTFSTIATFIMVFPFSHQSNPSLLPF